MVTELYDESMSYYATFSDLLLVHGAYAVIGAAEMTLGTYFHVTQDDVEMRASFP